MRGEGRVKKYDPNTIWSARQNNPELVVQDLKEEFWLNEQECQKVRYILLVRGINKWLLARRKVIELKHDVKEMVKDNPKDKRLLNVYMRLQEICKMPRWVEWPPIVTRNWKNIEEDMFIEGGHC